MSVEDKEFMDLRTKAVTVKQGHYYLPLPFRVKDVVLPNNHDVAAQRTLSLQEIQEGFCLCNRVHIS